MKGYETHEDISSTSAEERTNSVEIAREEVEEREPSSIDFVAYEDEVTEELRRLSFSRPTREQVLNWLPFGIVVLLGAVLRFWGLGDKPLHHDESMHAYFSLQLMRNLENWVGCFNPGASCYHYDPVLHGPFQFHAIALVYQISQWLGVYDQGVNTFTARIVAAMLGTVIVALPFFLRDYLGKVGAWLACLLLAISPSMVYFSRFAREDIYMACFTLLMVVAVARYVRDRKARWIITAAAAFSLSYATKEATFLTIAIFGSFLGALLVWEIGVKWPIRSSIYSDTSLVRLLPRTGAPLLVLAYFLILAPIAKVVFGWMKNLSLYIADPKNTATTDNFMQNLKGYTVDLVPWIGIILGVYVLSILAREMLGKMPQTGRHGMAKYIDPQKQPLLDAIFTMPWTYWFFALLCGWTIFLLLFTVVFTNIRGGIGDGIWQGLYYWLQQQQVARGGQPWYYYLLLIPLYEQIGVVFSIVGIFRCIVRPTRFHLFLVYWFIGNVVIYSWAAEKMPWLMIHMTLPMLLLAAVGLEPVVVIFINVIKGWFARSHTMKRNTSTAPLLPSTTRSRVGMLSGSSAALGLVSAILLLLPTVHNMYEVSYVHAADGPHEMMVYVQTTTDVNTVMAKVDEIDQKVYGGKHLMPIGLMNDATWPFAWYLRDYSYVCFNYPTGCPSTAKNIPVIITGQDNLYQAEAQYATPTNKTPANYAFHQYHMRTWWDEGYKPPICIQSTQNTCEGQQTWPGVGPFLWLSYGDNPPPHATFNLRLAAQHIWQWWWQRRAIGNTDGTYDMGLFIRKDLGVTP
ncbi:MAG: TIGR03663 family protein [Chloroflexi bacterium]|nr:TIGR03663 family protein [Chloroflexota bacterium]